MLHKGIRQFSSQEMASLSLSQLGFDILHHQLNGLGGLIAYEAKDFGIKYWVEIKAVDANATVKAQVMCAGMDLTTRDDDNSNPKGVATDDLVTGKFYGSPTYGGSVNFKFATSTAYEPITLLQGKSITGVFDKITPATASNLVMAIRGPKID